LKKADETFKKRIEEAKEIKDNDDRDSDFRETPLSKNKKTPGGKTPKKKGKTPRKDGKTPTDGGKTPASSNRTPKDEESKTSSQRRLL
jgi:hypothetical protein